MPGRRTERIRAIVLDRTKLKEQDLILTLLVLDGQQVRAVAKGARKPGSRLAARTELFCDLDGLLSLGRGLGILSEAQTIDAHEGVRGDLDKLACASAVCEVARYTCYEDVADPYLHPILTRALRAVEQAQDAAQLDLVAAAYLLKVLSHEGWRPELDSCVACGETPATRFSVASGGVLCESCAREVAGAEPVSEGLLGWLRALILSTFDALLNAPIDDATAQALLAHAHAWAATHLDVRLRAVEFLRGL